MPPQTLTKSSRGGLITIEVKFAEKIRNFYIFAFSGNFSYLVDTSHLVDGIVLKKR